MGVWRKKNPVFTGLALSSEARILWALSNFFLQLFVWGLPTSLFLSWASTEWEGFLFLAFITGLIGVIWGVVPLWVVLYPSRNLPKQPDKSKWNWWRDNQGWR